jgi:hypothetical protein
MTVGASGEDVPLIVVSGKSGEATDVSGHPAPIAGLVEECPPWPT